MIQRNIQNLLEHDIVGYLDVISIIKLEMTCKRYQKSDSFWIDRLKTKYSFSVPEKANPKEYLVMIELIYEYDDANMLKYLNYLARSDTYQNESLYSFTFWNNISHSKCPSNKLIKANNKYQAMSKFFVHFSDYIFFSYKHHLILDQGKKALMKIKDKPITGYITYVYCGEINLRFINLKNVYHELWTNYFGNNDTEINLIQYEDYV